VLLWAAFFNGGQGPCPCPAWRNCCGYSLDLYQEGGYSDVCLPSEADAMARTAWAGLAHRLRLGDPIGDVGRLVLKAPWFLTEDGPQRSPGPADDAPVEPAGARDENKEALE
jgi:hypothetical protein